MFHALGYSHVEVKRKMLAFVVKFFELRSHISHCHTKRKIFILVEIIKSHVNRNSTGRIFRVFGVDETHCGAADPGIGKSVTILGADAKIFGRNITSSLPSFISTLNVAIVYIVRIKSERMPFAYGAYIRCRSNCRTFEIRHIIQVYGVVAHGSKQSRICKSQSGIVVHYRNIHASQRSRMRRCRQF